jgi:hypothetical protein
MNVEGVDVEERGQNSRTDEQMNVEGVDPAGVKY